MDTPGKNDTPTIYVPAERTDGRRLKDRSYLAIGAWTLGLLAVGLLLFRYAGTVTTAEPTQPLLNVPPVPINPPSGVAIRQTPTTLEDGLRRAKLAAQNTAKQRIRLEQNKRASFGSATKDYIAGYIINESDLAIASWKVTAKSLNIGNVAVSQASAKAKEPLAPGTRAAFGIDLPRKSNATRLTMTLSDVKFAD